MASKGIVRLVVSGAWWEFKDAVEGDRSWLEWLLNELAFEALCKEVKRNRTDVEEKEVICYANS